MILATAHHVSPAFNADFYMTAATVIPVLFLAIAVQGTTYENLLGYSTRTAARLVSTLWRFVLSPGPSARDLARGLSFVLVFPVLGVVALIPSLIAAAVLLSGFSGEAESLIALYHRQAPTGPISVLTATLILTAGTATGPGARLARALFWPGPSRRAAGDRGSRPYRDHGAQRHSGRTKDHVMVNGADISARIWQCALCRAAFTAVAADMAESALLDHLRTAHPDDPVVLPDERS